MEYDYLVVGIETGASGTQHWQGYVCLKSKQRLTQLKKLLPTAHFEVMRGTPLQASEYCKKDGRYEEFGILPKTGGQVTQDKWRDIHQLARDASIDKFYEEHAMQSFLNANKFEALVRHYRPVPVALETIDARWYIGPSGSGKSLTARQEFPDLYLKPTATKWWPDYNQEETILIDDLGKEMGYQLEHLKIWADHYPFRAETKGAHTALIRPKTIIVTTQYHWSEMTEDTELKAAIARRFVLRPFGEYTQAAQTTQSHWYNGFNDE